VSRQDKIVLLATGDLHYGDAARYHLRRAGFLTVLTSDRASCLAAVGEQPLQLALLFLDLPAPELLTLAAELRALAPDLPTAICAGQDRALLEAATLSGVSLVCQELPLPAALARMVDSLVAGGGSPEPLSAHLLQPGQLLWLEVCDHFCSGRFPTTLLASQPTALAVSPPHVGGLAVTLSAGTDLTVGFGSPQGWYQFQSQVIATTFRQRESRLLITQPQVLNHQQRRRHLRARARFPVRLAMGAQELVGETQDLSRGGLRALLDTSAAPGSTVVVDISGMRTPARSVWSRPSGSGHLLAVEFAPGDSSELASHLSTLGVRLP